MLRQACQALRYRTVCMEVVGPLSKSQNLESVSQSHGQKSLRDWHSWIWSMWKNKSNNKKHIGRHLNKFSQNKPMQTTRKKNASVKMMCLECSLIQWENMPKQLPHLLSLRVVQKVPCHKRHHQKCQSSLINAIWASYSFPVLVDWMSHAVKQNSCPSNVLAVWSYLDTVPNAIHMPKLQHQ